MKKQKTKNYGKWNMNLQMQRDELRALPRSQVSEPTRSPFVVWSTRERMIISEHNSKREAVSALSKLRKDVKAGKYNE